jgi:FixJ family two-component response regulator
MKGATIFIVDDDPSIRRSLERLFQMTGYKVASFASANEFLACNWQNYGVGCLLLDISMPDFNGLQLQEMLAAAKSNLPIIFITGHGDIPKTVTAMKGGAQDVLQKPAKQTDLLAAVDKAIERHRQSELQRQDLEFLREHIRSLTPRELEVMELVVQGLLNKQIADRLGAAEKTIKVHRGRVMRKMNVQSVADLVRQVEKSRANSVMT